MLQPKLLAALVVCFCVPLAVHADTTGPGRFGKALSPKEVYAAAERNTVYFVVPMTVECWAKIGGDGDAAKVKTLPTILLSNEPRHSLTKQYAELLATEGVTLSITPDGIEALADIAYEVNRTTQNIGARRLHTILERVVEDVSYEGPDMKDKRVVIDANYVRGRLTEVLQREDLGKFIL